MGTGVTLFTLLFFLELDDYILHHLLLIWRNHSLHFRYFELLFRLLTQHLQFLVVMVIFHPIFFLLGQLLLYFHSTLCSQTQCDNVFFKDLGILSRLTSRYGFGWPRFQARKEAFLWQSDWPLLPSHHLAGLVGSPASFCCCIFKAEAHLPSPAEPNAVKELPSFS